MLNDLFASELTANGIAFEREFKAIPGRRYSFDFKVGNLLIEIQGGIWMKRSGHNSGSGIQRDADKLNLATLEGYAVMHFTTEDVECGEALEMVQKYLQSPKEELDG